jgi:hypothetical protein
MRVLNEVCGFVFSNGPGTAYEKCLKPAGHSDPHGQVTVPVVQKPAETRLERLIASQFRKGGVLIPMTPHENAKFLRSSLEQRCDFVAKVVVWTARGLEKHIKLTEAGVPKPAQSTGGDNERA